MTVFRHALMAAVLAVGACSNAGAGMGDSGLDLHDNPAHGVAKEDGPLTIPPAHLKDGGSE